MLRRLDRGRVDVKRALPDGRRKIVMTGVELLEKLVPLNTRACSRVMLGRHQLKTRPVPPNP